MNPELANNLNPQETAPLDAETMTGFQRLDPRAVRLWRTSYSIGFGIPLGILLLAASGISLTVAGAWPWVAVGWLSLFGLAAWFTVWHPPRAYRAWGYRVDEQVLEIRSGIWFRVLRLLPLSRLQHVDLHRGPLERSYGLASLVLHTAGTQEATIQLPGLDANEAVALRDRLLAAGGDDAV